MTRPHYIVNGVDFRDYLHHKNSNDILRLSGSQSLDRLVIKTDNRRGVSLAGRGGTR